MTYLSKYLFANHYDIYHAMQILSIGDDIYFLIKVFKPSILSKNAKAEF